ncbi:hypothetical protein CASFOL_027235 [Castilleja foliolosa]|uniref:VAN3-binding protein-like auxin canalisation domain-containing protein n=1 Tax=Castilleja foliolosa TaxID=1961234 RepID=A0ABD3CFW8_9LAMI
METYPPSPPPPPQALRGVATLKARALKEVWSVAAAIPIEKGLSIGGGGNNNNSSSYLFEALRGVARLKARALKEVWSVAAAIPIEKGLSIGGENTGTVPSANSRLSPLPHEPADYDRGATVDIPLDSAQDFKKKEKELQAKEAELKKREQIFTSWRRVVRVLLYIIFKAADKGGASGIGLETARVLDLRNAHVFIAARNMKVANKAKQLILKDHKNARVDVLKLDMASVKSIKAFADNFIALNLPLNILIYNAGIMFCPCPYQLSEDGVEIQLATNHLGHFFLTNLLLDKMKETASSTGIEGRIVNLSLLAHKYAYDGE